MWKMERAVSQKKTDAMNFPDPLSSEVLHLNPWFKPFKFHHIAMNKYSSLLKELQFRASYKPL